VEEVKLKRKENMKLY